MEPLEQLAWAAIACDAGDPRRIHHLLKVHAFARLIGLEEGLDPGPSSAWKPPLTSMTSASTKENAGTATAPGKSRKNWGPGWLSPSWTRPASPGKTAERIKWLIGHHHTYASIDGPDAQILAEADMLVNPYEDGTDQQQDEALYQRMYKTETGKKLFRELYLTDWAPGKQVSL